jgi:cytochrome c peroxidase
MRLRWPGMALLLGAAAACGGDSAAQPAGAADAGAPDSAADGGKPMSARGALVPPEGSIIGDFRWNLPAGFPLPVVPAGNPMSTAKVALGRRLFYDKRLSGNATQSCGTCHKQELAFTDGRATGLGSTGQAHPRGPMSLVNVAYASSLTWANPLFAFGVMAEPLERQSELPMYGDSPVELGIKSQTQIEERLRNVAEYGPWFEEAFPQQAEPITAQNISRAIAAFERTLISGRSPFDRYLNARDEDAISESAKRGYELFNSEELECFHCHEGFNMSDHVHWQGKPSVEVHFHNTGLYNVDGKGAYPEPNTGVYNVTMEPKDMGAFKAPTLRNIALTAPYMHDGSVSTLSEVLDHYAAGGRTLRSGVNAGAGKNNPLKDKLLRGFKLTEEQRADVIAFLMSLTDEQLLQDETLSDPWTDDQLRAAQ